MNRNMLNQLKKLKRHINKESLHSEVEKVVSTIEDMVVTAKKERGISSEKILTICRMFNEGQSLMEIAKNTNLTFGQVNGIIHYHYNKYLNKMNVLTNDDGFFYEGEDLYLFTKFTPLQQKALESRFHDITLVDPKDAIEFLASSFKLSNKEAINLEMEEENVKNKWTSK